MKKAIIALLTTILAAFGYVVVDKTTDSRLATLESQVSSQQEVIESLHYIGKYSIGTTTRNEITNYSGNGVGRPTTTTKKATEYNNFPTIQNDPFYTEQNYTKQLLSNNTTQQLYLGYDYFVDNTIYYHQLKEGDKATQTDISLYVTSIKISIYAKEEVTRMYYNSDMSVISDYYTRYRIFYEVTGYTDSSLAGATLTFNSNHSNGTTIKEDGTFSCNFSSIIYSSIEGPSLSEVALKNVTVIKKA